MADQVAGGLLRDAVSGAVVAVTLSAAVAPLTTRGGFLVDSTGAVVVDDPNGGD